MCSFWKGFVSVPLPLQNIACFWGILFKISNNFTRPFRSFWKSQCFIFNKLKFFAFFFFIKTACIYERIC